MKNMLVLAAVGEVATGLPSFAPLRGPVEAIPAVPASRLVTIAAMRVHPCLAAPLRAMVAAARSAGVRLTGTAFRPTAAQIAYRRKNCRVGRRAPTASEILFLPTEACRPPTAPPGLSMHERGLAIDFKVTNGRVGAWLRGNAARFGFRNYPPERWHWSTNGE